MQIRGIAIVMADTTYKDTTTRLLLLNISFK